MCVGGGGGEGWGSNYSSESLKNTRIALSSSVFIL